MSKESKYITNAENSKASKLVKAMEGWTQALESYEVKPDGVWGAVATVTIGRVVIESKKFDLEFSVSFDDDIEANEASVTIYNLTDDTISNFRKGTRIAIEAGYETDSTGVIFIGVIDKVETKFQSADKVTTLTCFDDVATRDLENVTYAAGTTASYILKDLLNRTGLPIAVFKPRRDWTYKDEVKVDGDLLENIKTYSEVCGVSTTIKNGKIYCRYIKEYDESNFIVKTETGMIGYPNPFSEEVTAEDYTETVNGYEVEMILQHRIAAGSGVTLQSKVVNGHYRVCSGTHTFSPEEAKTKIKMY